MAARDFDITWVKQGPMESNDSPAAEAPEPEPAEPNGDGEGRLLEAFRSDPDAPMHVIDASKAAGMRFDEGLRGVLDLVVQDDLEIVQRDEVASDHLVRLTAAGRQRLGIA